MRATAFVLPAIIISGAIAMALIAPPSGALDAASKDAAKITAGAHTPQPEPTIQGHQPQPEPNACRRFHNAQAHARCVAHLRRR